MARGGGKWACMETTTRLDGSKFARWFAAPFDMSGTKGDKVISCSVRGGGAISAQGLSSK